MRRISILISYLVITSFLSISALGGEKHEYVIIDKAASAPVRIQPNSNVSLGRLTAGSKVEVFGKKKVRSGPLAVVWYQVKVNGKNGWISQYVTMGNVITEDIDTGSKKTKRELGADKPRKAEFNEEAKKTFRDWALNKTAVTWLKYQEDGLIWIRLSPAKYTSKENVQHIADFIARAYRNQTNFNKPIVVTIWDPHTSRVWAKGRLP